MDEEYFVKFLNARPTHVKRLTADSSAICIAPSNTPFPAPLESLYDCFCVKDVS